MSRLKLGEIDQHERPPYPPVAGLPMGRYLATEATADQVAARCCNNMRSSPMSTSTLRFDNLEVPKIPMSTTVHDAWRMALQ